MAKLLQRKVEYSDEYQGLYVFGYFDELPTPQEAAGVYFERPPGDRPAFSECAECAILEDGFNVEPEKTDDGWRILLGDAC